MNEEEARKYSDDEVIVQWEKQSKSKGNGMAPESMTKVYGVDALRASIMFGAPPEKDLNFDQASIQQFVQYLNRVFKLTDQIP